METLSINLFDYRVRTVVNKTWSRILQDANELVHENVAF